MRRCVMKSLREYIMDRHAGIIYLYTKNKVIMPLEEKQYAFQRYRCEVAIQLDKKFGRKYEEIFLCETEEELKTVLTELEAIVEMKKLDEDIVYGFLMRFEMEGSFDISTCKKVFDLMYKDGPRPIELKTYYNLFGQTIKSRKRLYWKYDFGKK